MFCLAGGALLHQFETAVEDRAEARDCVLRSDENRDQCEECLYSAKQRYADAFVAWVIHRSSCVGCRAESLGHDVEQFASV
jgi:hypothetical protein